LYNSGDSHPGGSGTTWYKGMCDIIDKTKCRGIGIGNVYLRKYDKAKRKTRERREHWESNHTMKPNEECCYEMLC
jgi:hypothetical protein